MSMSTMSAANNPVGVPATRAHLTASAVRTLPVPAIVLIRVCSVARTLVRSGIFSPDQCLDQPWYDSTEWVLRCAFACFYFTILSLLLLVYRR